MGEFSRNLWEQKLGKLEALRQAQLTMLRHYNPVKGQIDRGLTSMRWTYDTMVGRNARFNLHKV